jgi:hypothetical protein
MTLVAAAAHLLQAAGSTLPLLDVKGTDRLLVAEQPHSFQGKPRVRMHVPPCSSYTRGTSKAAGFQCGYPNPAVVTVTDTRYAVHPAHAFVVFRQAALTFQQTARSEESMA